MRTAHHKTIQNYTKPSVSLSPYPEQFLGEVWMCISRTSPPATHLMPSAPARITGRHRMAWVSFTGSTLPTARETPLGALRFRQPYWVPDRGLRCPPSFGKGRHSLRMCTKAGVLDGSPFARSCAHECLSLRLLCARCGILRRLLRLYASRWALSTCFLET